MFINPYKPFLNTLSYNINIIYSTFFLNNYSPHVNQQLEDKAVRISSTQFIRDDLRSDLMFSEPGATYAMFF